ncbi:MAG: hypothetical protein WDN26_19520 [Chitinophagaceae bacterium]
MFYPFQTAIKKYAGVDYKTFRQQAFDYYKKNTTSLINSDKQNEAGPLAGYFL